jgi:hypothetical protein
MAYYASEPSGGAGHAAVCLWQRLAATGTKSFQIDHPLSPETHYLNHFCAEGPEPMNAYLAGYVSSRLTTARRGYSCPTTSKPSTATRRYHAYSLSAQPMPNLHVAVKIQRQPLQNRGRRTWQGGQHGAVESRPQRPAGCSSYGYQTEQEKEDAIKGKYLQSLNSTVNRRSAGFITALNPSLCHPRTAKR